MKLSELEVTASIDTPMLDVFILSRIVRIDISCGFPRSGVLKVISLELGDEILLDL